MEKKQIFLLRNVIKNLMLMGHKERAKQMFLDDRILPFLANEFLPKSKYLLVNSFISDIMSLKFDMRNLIIITNLYYENVIDNIFAKELKKPHSVLEFSYHQKLKIIDALQLVDTKLIDFLLFHNNIRNKFAHNLDYDISDSEMLCFIYFKKVIQRYPYKQKYYRTKRNYYLFIVYSIDILYSLIEKYPYLTKIKR